MERSVAEEERELQKGKKGGGRNSKGKRKRSKGIECEFMGVEMDEETTRSELASERERGERGERREKELAKRMLSDIISSLVL